MAPKRRKRSQKRRPLLDNGSINMLPPQRTRKATMEELLQIVFYVVCEEGSIQADGRPVLSSVPHMDKTANCLSVT
jgi:hypothetical protein